MPRRAALTVLLAGSLIATAAMANEMAPTEGRSLSLGPMTGVAYYTAEPDGAHLVATLADPAGGTPIRFIATLTSGQAVTLSVPRGPGEPAIEVVFRREGDRVVMSEPPPVIN